jgi:hypothetical protein
MFKKMSGGWPRRGWPHHSGPTFHEARGLTLELSKQLDNSAFRLCFVQKMLSGVLYLIKIFRSKRRNVRKESFSDLRADMVDEDLYSTAGEYGLKTLADPKAKATV